MVQTGLLLHHCWKVIMGKRIGRDIIKILKNKQREIQRNPDWKLPDHEKNLTRYF
jgi:hypothetical protein